MMRKRVKIGRRKPVEEPEIIVIPMIDVMMFLLFFFIVASLAMVVQSGLPVNLPKASQSSEHSSQNLTITITREGKIYVNTKATAMGDISKTLTGLHVSAENLVIINADANVAHGLVVGVINETLKAGLTHYTFATEKS